MREELKIIADQVGWRELHLANFKLLFDDKERLLILKKDQKRMAIKLMSNDLYKVVEQKFKKDWTFTQEVHDNVYCDMLKNFIEDFFKFEYVMDGILCHLEVRK